MTTTVARWFAGQLDDRGRLAYQWAMPHACDRTTVDFRHDAGRGCELIRASCARGRLAGGAVLSRRPRRHAAPRPVSGRYLQTRKDQSFRSIRRIRRPTSSMDGCSVSGASMKISAMGDLIPADITGRASAAFEDGISALAARLPLYDAWGWSRYDLFPHPIVHVASPFYHRLHIEQLLATNELAPDDRLQETAARWERSSRDSMARAAAVSRKVVFRVIRPRSRRVRGPRSRSSEPAFFAWWRVLSRSAHECLEHIESFMNCRSSYVAWLACGAALAQPARARSGLRNG